MRCENADVLKDGRLVSPSAARNRGPIAAALAKVLPKRGLVLEVSSGAGQHVAHFGREMPYLKWQPTECDAGCLKSIAGWLAAEPLTNVNAPVCLNVYDEAWPVAQADAVVCINMIHIAPASATEALFRGAGRAVIPGGILFLYGPFRKGGRHTAPSNEAFDRLLRSQNPEWGVRDLDEVTAIADAHGFALEQTFEMPANNLSVVFRKS